MFSESSPEIGLGHLVECRALVERWSRFHSLKEWMFLVEGDEGAVGYLDSWGLPYRIVGKGFVPAHAEAAAYDAILVNKKAVSYPFLQKVRSLGKRTAVIDELGHKAITADVLVNFSANTARHQYDFPDGKPLTLFGPSYFPASLAVADRSKKAKPAASNTVLVSMGGYDASRITDKVIAALAHFPQLRKQVILGPGFKRDAAFDALAAGLDGTFEFFSNVSDMAERIHAARLLVCSGGNTVYEAALLKTPIMVIGEEPHEMEQGAIFEKMGAARNVARGKHAPPEDVLTALKDGLDLSPSGSAITLTDWYDELDRKGDGSPGLAESRGTAGMTIVPKWLFKDDADVPPGKLLFLSSFEAPSGSKRRDDFVFMPEPWPHIQNWETTSEQLERVFNNLFEPACGALNDIHKTDFPPLFWRLPLSFWLTSYIHVLYNIWHRLNAARQLHGESIGVAMPAVDLDWNVTAVAFDTLNDGQYAALVGMVAHEMGMPVHRYEADGSKTMAGLTSHKSVAAADFFEHGIKQVKELLECPVPLTEGDDVIISGIKLPRAAKALMGKKLGAKFHLRFEKPDRPVSIGRERLQTIRCDSPFEQMLVKLMPRFMPKALLEDFPGLLRQAKRHERVKVFAAGTGWYHDIPFSIAASWGRLKGAKVVAYQHGGGYGQFSCMELERVERFCSDYMITWGWEDVRHGNNKLLPLSSCQMVVQKRRRFKNSKLILFPSAAVPNYIYRFQPYPFMVDFIPHYFAWKNDFLKHLNADARRNITYRAASVDYGWMNAELGLLRRYSEIKVDWSGRFDGVLKKAELFITDHRGTTFLQALAAGVPTVLFWDHFLDPDRPSAAPYFDALRQNGILFDDPEKAAAAVNGIWPDVEGWWNDAARQKAVQAFVGRFASNSADWLDQWVAALNAIKTRQ